MRFRYDSAPPSLSDYQTLPASSERKTGGRGGEKSAPQVSVVTVARNAAATIERTLRSVQAQTGCAVEHIVVDGGSTDGTFDILKRQGDALALWISEPDRGIADAFNKGVALARGDIIGILNADDEYEPGAVAASVEALNRNPEAGFSFGGCVMVDSQDERIARASLDYSESIAYRMTDSLCHPTVFVRRSVYERFGLFRTEYRIAMDYDFLLRIHRAGVRPVLVSQTIARMHRGGVSERLLNLSRRETLEVSIRNGESPAGALSSQLFRGADYYAWEALKRLGWPRLKRRIKSALN